MATIVNFDGPMAPSELAALEAEAQRQAQAAGHDQPSGVRVHANCETVTTTYTDGRSSSQGVSRATIRSDAPGTVQVGGLTTSIEAARAAGLIPPEGFPGAAGNSSASAPAATPAEDTATADDGPEDGEEEDRAVPAAVQEAVNAASAHLGAYAEQHGADVVTAHLDRAIQDGELPEALPDGFTQTQADEVVAGYIASANHTLGETGADVAMLTGMLSNDELAQARRSTVYGDHDTLKALGQSARSRLASLPFKDQARFRELIETLPEDQRPTMGTHGPEFNFPGVGRLTWGQAVLRGIVKFR